MKKTILTALLTGCLVTGNAGFAITETIGDYETVTIATDSTYNGAYVNYENGVLSGIFDSHKISFDLTYGSMNTAGALIYQGSGVEFGFWSTADGGITGAWRSGSSSQLAAWTGQGTVSSSVFSGLDTDNDGSVRLSAWFDNSQSATYQGTYMAAGDAVTTTGSTINASASTSSTTGNLYGATGLRGADTNMTLLTVNTDYISQIYISTPTAATITNSSSTWSKKYEPSLYLLQTSGEAKYTYNTQANAGTKDIIIGGSGLFYITTKESDTDAGAVTLDNTVYLGKSTNSFDAAHFNNSDYTTTLNGNIYVVEDTAMSARGTSDIIVNGDVTDKNVDGSANLGTKLTIKGQGYIFNGVVDVTSLEFANNTQVTTRTAGATFKLGFNATNVTLNASSQIVSEAALTLTNLTVAGSNATLDAALELTNGSLTLAATLDLGDNALVISNMELAGSLLDSLTEGGSITLFTGVSTLSNNATGAISEETPLKVSDLFTNLDDDTYLLNYSNGNVSIAMAPEPTTATLSLLALAGLAARRRRR